MSSRVCREGRAAGGPARDPVAAPSREWKSVEQHRADLLLDCLPQEPAGAMQSRLHRLDLEAEQLGCLLDAHLFEDAGDEHGAERIRQLVDAASPARRPVDAGAVTSRLTKGMCHPPFRRSPRRSLRPAAPARLLHFLPVRRACPRRSRSTPPLRWFARPARAAASSHLLRRAPFRSSALRSIAGRRNAQARWLPFVPRLDATDSRAATARHGDHARRSRRHDQVGVAAPDIDRACLQRHRTAHFDHLKLALTIEPFGKRTGEARRHMLRNQHRPGKPERQLRQHDVERGRAAGRGPDQHQSQRRVGLACRSPTRAAVAAGAAEHPAPRN